MKPLEFGSGSAGNNVFQSHSVSGPVRIHVISDQRMRQY